MTELDTKKLLNALGQTTDFVRSYGRYVDGMVNPIRTLVNVVELLSKQNFETSEEKMWNIRVNAIMIGRHPTLFDNPFFMSAPVSLIETNGERFCITSRSKLLMNGFNGDDAHNDNMIENMSPVCDELAADVRKMQDEGMTICWHFPLLIFRSVDENSFQPKIQFKSRFGAVDMRSVG